MRTMTERLSFSTTGRAKMPPIARSVFFRLAAALRFSPALQRRLGPVKGSRQLRDRLDIELIEQREAGFKLCR
jgi:hypothetical protein